MIGKFKTLKKISALTLLTALINPHLALAGPSFKEKIQKRIQEQRNYQYQSDDSSHLVQQIEYQQAETITHEPSSSIPSSPNYAVYETLYNAELQENVVTINAKAVFEIFDKGPAFLPLVGKNIGLIDVKLNRGTAFISLIGDTYYLKVNKPGKYTLNMEYLIKAVRERENGPGQFSFSVLPAPIAQYEFVIPEDHMEIFVDPSIKLEQKTEAGKTVAWAILPHTSTIKTRWSQALPKEEIKQVKLDPKLYAESSTYATIGNGIIQAKTAINYSILQSEVTTLRLSIPEDTNILDVKSADLRDWKLTLDQGVKYLDVYLNYGLKGSYTLYVDYERSIGSDSGTAQIPTIKALGVEREFGYVGIAAKTNVELDVHKLNRAMSIDAKELPASISSQAQSPILLAFKYVNHPFDIIIDVTRHTEIPVLMATVDQADYLTLQTEHGHTLTRATFLLRNNVKQYLRLTLPKGAALWSAFVSNTPVKPAEDKEGHLLIPLLKSQTAGQSLNQFSVEIVYLQKQSPLKALGKFQMQLPQMDIPVSEVRWSTYMPEDLSFFGFQGDLKLVKDPSSGFNIFGMQNYAQRTLQARIRDASSYYVPTSQSVSDTTQYEPYYLKSNYALGRDEATSGGFRTSGYENPQATKTEQTDTPSQGRGTLPIRIQIPEKGQLLTFTRLLIVPQESPEITFHYTVWITRAVKILKTAGFIALFMLLGITLVRRTAQRRRKKSEAQLATQ